MLENNIIFVAGMPRAGSMWTYNVARELITLTGRKPWPVKVSTDEQANIRQALAGKPEHGHINCIKTHYAIKLNRADFRVLCNIRDVREATLSFMRFTKCGFDEALESARESMKITDHYLGSNSPTVLPVDFDDVVNAPTETVSRIARFIEVDPGSSAIDEIVASLSRERMTARLKALEKKSVNSHGEFDNPDDVERFVSIRNSDGSFRVSDNETGFQSNHITSTHSDEWREAFTLEQQNRLNDLLGNWLARYGYDL